MDTLYIYCGDVISVVQINCIPAPNSSRLRVYLCVFPITGHPLSRENFCGIFHIISTPFLGNFSHITPYLRNITVTNIPFLYIIFFSSGSGNTCTYFTITLWGPITDIQYNKGPIPFSREGTEGSGHTYKYINHIPHFSEFFGKFLKNTPYLRISV